MERKFSLEVLDEYAKTLTKKQVNMLYESKCKKSYEKPLYENLKYQGKDFYNIYLDNYVMNESNLNKRIVLSRYVNKYELQYNVVNEGVYLYTNNFDNYKSLIERLVSDGVSKSSLQDVVKYPEILEMIEK